MKKYTSVCDLCKHEIFVAAEFKNTKDLELNISCDCPNMKGLTDKPIVVDAIKEVISDQTKSTLYRLVKDVNHAKECTAYKDIKSAIEAHLGWYYEMY